MTQIQVSITVLLQTKQVKDSVPGFYCLVSFPQPQVY